MNWKCKHTWERARTNTLWCLLGCSIGDFGTIFYFQNVEHDWSTFEIMSLALVNGLLTSIVLETIILLKQMGFKIALKTALGMSFISMLGITWWATPIMLFMGFITPLPYNYWRLKKYNVSCH